MKIDIRRQFAVRLYLPDGTDNADTLNPLLRHAGGGTMWVGKGCWTAPVSGELVAEDVGVHEFLLTDLNQYHAAEWLGDLGVAWLHRNQGEQCFLAYAGEWQVKINRN